MTAHNFQYRGIGNNQGLIFSGLTATSTYQTQFHGPLKSLFAFIPNGRIVYLDENGYLTPECPATAVGEFAMPMLLAEGGGKINHVPITYAANQGTPHSEAPYISAIPQPSPNVLALPLSVGAEFLSTEYDITDPGQYEYNQALTSVTDTSGGYDDVGKIVPLTASTQMCIGFVSRKPGTPRHYGDPATTPFNPSLGQRPNPNPMAAVTGKNLPGLTFWGCPLPCGTVKTADWPLYEAVS